MMIKRIETGETEQQLNEKNCRKEARKNYTKTVDKAIEKNYFSSTKPGRHYTHERLVSFAQALSERVDKYSRKIREKNNASQYCEKMESIIRLLADYEIDEETQKLNQVPMSGEYYVALIGMKAIIDVYSRSKDSKVKVITVANRIGDLLDVECQYKQIFSQESIPKFVKNYGKKLLRDPDANPKNRRSNARMGMTNLMKHIGIDYVEPTMLTQDEINNLGIFVLDTASQECIIETKNEYISKQRQNKHLEFTNSFHESIQTLDEIYYDRAYFEHPLTQPPQPWEVMDCPSVKNASGGFHYQAFRNANRMCRGFDCATEFKGKAVELLNRLQETAYHIDNAVFNVAKELNDSDINVGTFHTCPPEVMPCQRNDSDDAETIRKRKKDKHDEHRAHGKAVKQYMRTQRIIALAKTMEDCNEFYYAWSADYRGRMYPISRLLHVQGCDFERSLIRFKEGCEMTPSAIKWVKRAIGAAYDGTSESYKHREDWTTNNEDLIIKVATDPVGNVALWEAAKEPWSFLQFCLEWYSVMVAKTKTYWHIPVGVDSTASGLQLLSAMLKDEQGMRYANLLPSDDNQPPLDAYKTVLAIAEAEAKKDGKDYLLEYFQYRNVGKPAVMLSIYGGSYTRIKDKIGAYLKENKIEIEPDHLKELTSYVVKASKDTFPAAYKALAWLKKLSAKAFDKGATSLTWTTPTDDTINLKTNEMNVVRIKTELMGTINASLGEKDNKPDFKSMKSSFPPAYVHSMDATLCKEMFHNWHRPLILIHDCYRCAASDMEHSVEMLKDAFQSVCSGNPLKQLADDLGVTEDELPRLDQGNCEVNNVQKSIYFFN